MALFRLLAKIPVELPSTTEELDCFTTRVMHVYNLPETDEYVKAVASAIQHATQSGSHKVSPYAVYSFVRRAMAMRTAYQRIHEFNKKEAKEAEEKKAKEAQSEPLQDACIQAAST